MDAASTGTGSAWEPARTEEFRAYLDRLLASPPFASSRRRAQLLGYLVERTLTGEAGQVTEYGIGLDVFQKPASFDPRLEATVRVEMSRLRRALIEYYDSEGRRDPWRIQFAKRGYVAAIRAVGPSPDAGSQGVEAGLELQVLPAARGRRRMWVAGGAAMALALTFVALQSRLFQTPAGPIHSLAVLPLANLSGDATQDYFADGITEELITDLAGIRPRQVTSHTSVMPYKGTRKPLRQIARELNVDAVIEGSATRSGRHLHVTAQLIRTSTGTHIWAGSYDGEPRDVPGFESQIAGAIAREVALRLDPKLEGRARAANAEAYALYIKGRHSWNQRELATAQDYFAQAIEKDPGYALAYAGLADACDLMAMDNHRPQDLLAKARAAAAKAIALDDRLPEAHTSLAAVKILGEWDWAGAEREFKRALALDPRHAPAHHWYATLYLAPLGRTDEAREEMRRACNLDPLSLIYETDYGWVRFLARQYGPAVEQYKSVLKEDPGFKPARFRLAQVYAAMGMYREALAVDAETVNLLGEARRAALIESAYKTSGYRGVLAMNLQAALREHALHREPGYHLAVLYLALGEKRQALDALRWGFTQHEPPMIFLKADPIFDGLRANPGFQALERRIGLLP
jgi:TolB-like protein/tetratricopeptide (TPR) repeat protein